MKYVIKPFLKVGDLYFGTKREVINNVLLEDLNYKSIENTNVKTQIKSINDYFDNGLVLGYLNSSFLLRYVVLTDPCERSRWNR